MQHQPLRGLDGVESNDCFAQFLLLSEIPLTSAMWNEPPYLRGWRLGFSLVYSNKIFENDAKNTRLNNALGPYESKLRNS